MSSEIKEPERLHGSLRDRLPDLNKEPARLIKSVDENKNLFCSRRCPEVIIANLCKYDPKSTRNKLIFMSVFVTFISILVACTKIERELKVETGTVTDITMTSARVEGDITDLGDGITDYGHCWSITANPDIFDSKTSLGQKSSTGSFTSDIQNLQAGTKYFIRAYAKSGKDVIYGHTDLFETCTLKDIDNNYYHAIKIGSQLWMKENLRTTKYNDGTDIPLVADNTTWSKLTTPGYCWYNNDSSTFKSTYGALYNWYTVDSASNGNKNVCLSGWHVPSAAEWITLTNFLGGEGVAGGKLKEIGLSHWVFPNTGATDESGFTALPNGYHNTTGSFDYIGYISIWWSSTEFCFFYSGALYIDTDHGDVFKGDFDKKLGFSVRCLKD